MRFLSQVHCILGSSHRTANFHLDCSASLRSVNIALHLHTHTHTCNETVLPGNGGQVVTVDIAIKLKDFSRLKITMWRKEKEMNKGSVISGRNESVRVMDMFTWELMQSKNLNFMINYTAMTLNKALSWKFNCGKVFFFHSVGKDLIQNNSEQAAAARS